MNPAHLLGRRPHDYVREINRFLPDAPSNGEKNNYRELQIRDRLNLGIVLLVSVILLPAATFSSCCLLIWLMYFFTLDILVVWHVDRQHDGLTDMRLKPYFWRRTHYSLTDVFAACKARKLSSSGHGFMLMLRRYRHSPHKLVRETGLSRKAAQRLEARVNEFLELGYASLEDNPPLHGQPNCP